MTEFRFAFATADDVPDVAALIERAYRGPQAATGWTNEAAILEGPRSSATEVARLVKDPDCRFLLALNGDTLAGSVLLKKQGDGAYLGMFAIDPGRQQQGLGKRMMAEAEAAVRPLWAARFLQLTVISLRDSLIESTAEAR